MAAAGPSVAAIFRRARLGSVAAALLCLWIPPGCSVYTNNLRDLRETYYAGKPEQARELAVKLVKKGGRTQNVYRLNQAVIDLSLGDCRSAENLLRTVRTEFDHLEQTALAEHALSAITDDNAFAYAGDDYEKILIRSFLGLSNLLGEGDDALAYSLQTTEKQNQLMTSGGNDAAKNPKSNYRRVAFGAYLHGVLAEESKFDYDDCLRAWSKVAEWEPEFPYAQEHLHRARHGAHSPPGHGAVYVFALVGRGPYKEEVNAEATQISLLVADRILSTGDYTLPPTVAPVPVPKIIVPDNLIRNVRVRVNGGPAAQTGVVTDIGKTAKQHNDAIYHEIIARAVVRRVVKKAAVVAAKQSMDIDKNSAANLAMDVVGILWEATESADTRCWSLLPETIQVVRLELPVGEHRLDLAAQLRGGLAGGETSVNVRVDDGRNTYVLASAPYDRIVGKPLTNKPGELGRSDKPGELGRSAAAGPLVPTGPLPRPAGPALPLPPRPDNGPPLPPPPLPEAGAAPAPAITPQAQSPEAVPAIPTPETSVRPAIAPR